MRACVCVRACVCDDNRVLVARTWLPISIETTAQISSHHTLPTSPVGRRSQRMYIRIVWIDFLRLGQFAIERGKFRNAKALKKFKFHKELFGSFIILYEMK